MAAQLVKSTTYKGKKIQLPRQADYRGTENGKHKYHVPGTDVWFLVQQVPGGWVVHEMHGGCNCN